MASVAYAWAPANAAAGSAAESWNNTAEATRAAQQDDAKPPKQDESKPTKETKEGRSSRPDNAHPQQPARPDQREKSDKQQPQTERRQPEPAPRDQRQPAAHQSSANQAHPEQPHHDHAQQGGGHSRIPDQDFRAHFGRPHTFAVRQVVTTTRVVPNQTHFVYGGYTFIFLDPWPDDWQPTDDCYIDSEGDEYFLIDVAHPGVRIALSIVGD